MNGWDQEDRLRRLEESHRKLAGECRAWKRRCWSALALGGLVGLLGAAATVPNSLEAQHFVLRDSAGRMRAALAMKPDGSPGLGFFDEAGRARLSMDLGTTGPSVNLMDGLGRPQAALAVRPDGTPGIGVFDANGRIRLSLEMTAAGQPGVHLYNETGRLRSALAIRPDGMPGLGFFDPLGQPRATFEPPADPAPAPRNEPTF